MTYHEAAAQLQGRCRESRKLQNNTYLQRRPGGDIAVRLHHTDVLTFSPSGEITLDTGGWHTVTTRDRINCYLPAPWSVGSERSQTILYRSDGRWHWNPLAVIAESLTIMPTGEVEGGDDYAEFRERIRQHDNEVNRERSRIRYWIRKAREHKPAKSVTVQSILAEENISVRLAKMHVFGMERFLLESGAETLDSETGYELLRLKLTHWQDIRALKMTCPSTGAVYVATVAPNLGTIPEALDWHFDVKDYLGQVVQQS